MNLIVIDDFYRDPEAIRKMALHAEYRDVRCYNYPGFQSIHSYVSKEMCAKFIELVGRPLDISLHKITFGKFRIMLKGSASRLNVHMDGASDWAGLIYLNPPEQCEGGTAFYRHRETGLDGPVEGKDLERFGFETWQALEDNIIERDTLRPEAWEETMFVGMKFNRLVLFRGGSMFHCHTHSFGTDKENARMTQNFFFDEVK